MRYSTPQDGEMAEWLNAPVLKTGFRASGTGVRIPLSPPFFYAPITGDDSPQARELNVQDGVGFRAERMKDFGGGKVCGHIFGQDREEWGLGIDDERNRSVLQGIIGIRAGRACGRAAARRGDRWGEIFRTVFRIRQGLPSRRQGRLRRSAFVRQIQTLRSPQVLLAARDLATPALAGGKQPK